MPVRAETSAFLRGLELLQAGVNQAVGQATRAAIQATEESGRSTNLFENRSGETRGSIRGTYDGGGRGSVLFGGASRFLDGGTRAHVIRGNPLRFVVNGQTLFRRMVSHPGTAERPFVREARRVGEQTLDYGATYLLNEAIRRVR